MGDPRKSRKTYKTPMHPWQKERIDEEKEISRTYGTKNKQEIWKMGAVVTKLSGEAKAISGLTNEEERKKESEEVVKRARKLGLITQEQGMDAILGLKLRDVMERRLQTLVFKKGLALSINQARQFITHEHILVGNKKITSPSYVVPVTEESNINFSHDSPFCQPDHPERTKADEKQKQQPQAAAETTEEKKPKKKKAAAKPRGKAKEKKAEPKKEAPKEEAATDDKKEPAKEEKTEEAKA